MTKSPWHVSPDELFTMRGHGGVRFTEFVDALVRAEAALAGAPVDSVTTNIRVNIGDGGVDTKVGIALGGALDLSTPTAWQYKATNFREVSDGGLVEEIKKPRAAEHVRNGHIYCVCVCDDSTAEKKDERRAALLGAARELNPSAPPPRFLGAGELAEWATRFPAVVVRFFRPHLGEVLSYDAWLRKERADLPTYVPLTSRANIAQRIRDHATTEKPAQSVLTISGISGAGKSRLVAEVLADLSPLVLYTVDEVASLRLATSLVNDGRHDAIMVVDGCGYGTRQKLAAILNAAGPRLRAIAICDPLDPPADNSTELPPLEFAEIQSVLEANFKEARSSHRRAFGHFADGVLKIAAKLGTAYRADRSRFLVNADAWATRLHSAIGYVSPIEFELKFKIGKAA